MKESLLTGMEWSPAWGVGVQPHHLANVQLDQILGGGQHLQVLGDDGQLHHGLGDGQHVQVLGGNEPDQVLSNDEPDQILGNDEPNQVLGKQAGSPETKELL